MCGMSDPVPVTVENFVRAEPHRMMTDIMRTACIPWAGRRRRSARNWVPSGDDLEVVGARSRNAD
jgi:hypothetical protein